MGEIIFHDWLSRATNGHDLTACKLGMACNRNNNEIFKSQFKCLISPRRQKTLNVWYTTKLVEKLIASHDRTLMLLTNVMLKTCNSNIYKEAVYDNIDDWNKVESDLVRIWYYNKVIILFNEV